MKGSLFNLIVFLLVVFLSCKKEKTATESNTSPVAVAGPDQVISLPIDSAWLDGNSSGDPERTIREWIWTKFSGPASFNIVNANQAKTVVKSLVEGIYQFELRITDALGLIDADTIIITVRPSNTQWTRLSSPPGYGSGQTIILGIDVDNVFVGESFSKGFWKYDERTNSFIQKQNISAQACCQMVSFSVNGKGYAGMGLDLNQTFYSNQMYQFDPVSNEWTQKKNAPISGLATPLVVNGFVYLLQDSSVWMYDPNNDAYTTKKDFPVNTEYYSTAGFVIDGSGYYVSKSNCWNYDTSTDSWAPKSGLPEYLAVRGAFSLNGYGYVFADADRSSLNYDYVLHLWQYDPEKDQWLRLNDYPGDGTGAIKTASVNGTIYLGFGYKRLNNMIDEDDLAGDFWKFQ